MSVSHASKSGACLAASATASRRTSALCSSSTSSFFLHHLGHGQVAQLFTHPHQLVHDPFKLAHRVDLSAVEGNHGWIAETHGKSFICLFAGEERIRAALDFGTIGKLDGEELLGERSPAQFSQVGELSQEALTLLFEVRIGRGGRFHIVVYILQYYRQKQGKTPKPTFISSTPAVLGLVEKEYYCEDCHFTW